MTIYTPVITPGILLSPEKNYELLKNEKNHVQITVES